MTWEEFEKHKPFAGDRKPSMLRRRVGHDYQSRRIYLITMTVEGRRPLLGQLVGQADALDDSPDVPRVELTPLGEHVKTCWQAIGEHYPAIKVLATQVMPDHLHGILFVQEHMEQHLGLAIKGFKVGTNKFYRQQLPQAATLLQQRGQEETKGLLWARNYNDHILENGGELDRWFSYLRQNPRRLAIRRSHPEFFRVVFGITIGSQTYAAIGNRFLLSHPLKEQIQFTRSLTEDEVATVAAAVLSKARKGIIPVSPSISDGEKASMRAVLDARLPLIFLTPWGFNTYSKPGHQYYDACAEGRFLILAPWPHQNQRVPLTREMCLQLNRMAAEIAAYCPPVSLCCNTVAAKNDKKA